MSTYPLTNDDSQTISLQIPRDPVNYIDLSRSFLEIRLHGVGKDVKTKRVIAASEATSTAGAINNAAKGPLRELSTWTLANNIGASLFEMVKVSVNDHPIFHSANYPYQALMTKLLNSTPANRDSVQRLAWFALEEQTKWDAWGFGDDTAMLDRAQATHEGNSVNVFDRIYIPITYAYKPLPNNVSVRLELTQSRSEFSVIAAKPKTDELKYVGSGNTPDIKIHIDKLVWHVWKVRPYDHILESNNQRLINEAAIFFFPRRELRVFIMPGNTLSFHQLIFSGRKPHSITIAMVDDNDAIGNVHTNPFNFQPFNLQRCTLTVNNLLPTTPLEFDFSSTPQQWGAGYRLLAEATGRNAEFGEGPITLKSRMLVGAFIGRLAC